jgi:hypothetical protein
MKAEDIDRLLAPQRAVVVADCDALSQLYKSVPPGLVMRATKPVIDFFAAPSFHSRSPRRAATRFY